MKVVLKIRRGQNSIFLTQATAKFQIGQHTLTLSLQMPVAHGLLAPP